MVANCHLEKNHDIGQLFAPILGVATRARFCSFSQRVANAWNSLLRDTNFSSVVDFDHSKAKLDFVEFLKIDCMLS